MPYTFCCFQGLTKQALFHVALAIPLITCLLKLHKWSESAMFFDGSSLCKSRGSMLLYQTLCVGKCGISHRFSGWMNGLANTSIYGQRDDNVQSYSSQWSFCTCRYTSLRSVHSVSPHTLRPTLYPSSSCTSGPAPACQVEEHNPSAPRALLPDTCTCSCL